MYAHLKSDYERLQQKYTETIQMKETEDDQKDQRSQAMEEELTYLKKHFEIELGLLKDENDIL